MQPFGPWNEVGNATFSPCGAYRYSLTRGWDSGKPAVNFLMLNPSTADAEQDDPTVRRCLGFAKAWGFGVLYVTNLFALRATDPRALYKHPDPVGPDNDRCILKAAAGSKLVVAAWGVHGDHRQRAADVLRLLMEPGIAVHALKLTKAGSPCHPLYLPAKLTPTVYAPGRAA